MTIRKILTLITLIIMTYNGFSQVKGVESFDSNDFFKDNSSSKITSDKLQGEKSPTGNIVNPDYYYLGPGDILILQNLWESPIPEYLVINPESNIILPHLGEISLKGKTLSEACKLIKEKYLEKNPNAKVNLDLYNSRNVLVNIRGNYENAGIYSFPASYSISTALKAAKYQLKSNAVSVSEINEKYDKEKFEDERNKMLLGKGLAGESNFINRNIFVMHKDGSSEVIDLEKAFAIDEEKYDPYLREGDDIIIPYEPPVYSTISISGEVLNPKTIVFKTGDKASFLLKSAKLFTESADLNNIQLIMPPSNEKIKLNVDSSLNLIGKDYELVPNSMIIVGSKPYIYEKLYGVVSITGNVEKPGVYAINDKVTKLKELVELSGGFTKDAYLPLAKIIRKQKSFQGGFSIKDYMDFFQYSDLTLEDTIHFKIDMSNRFPFVSCNFDACFNNNSEKDNVVLMDGDVIIVPSNPQNIYIFGLVNNPGYIPYQKNKTMEWYISQAGGYATGANKSRARIIKGNNKIWVEADNSIPIEAGDEIYVPHPKSLPYGTEMQTFGFISALLSSGIALVYLILAITKK